MSRTLTALLILISLANLSYFFAIVLFGAGKVPTVFDLAFVSVLLALSPVAVISGFFVKSSPAGVRRWRSALFGLASLAVGLFLALIGIGRLT